MSIDLNTCTQSCHGCVKSYAKKHSLKKGDPFAIECFGIPKEYIPDSIASSLGVDPTMAVAMYDPVTWAAHMLDWHCIDPDGSIWKRKTEDGSIGEMPAYDEERAKAGKSIFHRPYQAEMIRCTSLNKAFRIGRQAGKTETLCIVMLHAIFTHANFPVVVIAPFQSQVDLIFTRLVNLVKSNPTLNNSVKRSVKAPNYMLELHNGAKVTGFTAGTRSGQDAGASRGQSAKMLVFDEADYLSAGDIDAALSIVTNFEDATVWMSSTPTGRREAFYKTCYSDLFKEFHYTSYVNPNFTKQKEALFRSRLTEAGFKHEVLAEFGEQEEGVYQVKYVEAAQTDYEYGDYKYNPTWTYMVGVDWNGVKTGSTLAVIGHNPADNCFYLVDTANVSRAQWTQLAACEKIKDLNRLWNPAAIYVDQGYGGTQVEVLQEYGSRMLVQLGHNHPDARLRHIVKPYDFGGKVEIRDYITKQPIKKPSKPFLVENSVRRFENVQFKYPASDEDFTAQLLGYIIDRVSVAGAPIYKAQNEVAGDHMLDAVNLAFVAFTFEKTRFGKPLYSTQVAFAGRFGEGSGKIGHLTMKEEASKHKPATGRSDMMQSETQLLKSPHGDLPASNTAVESSSKLWNWVGFGHDAPRPNPASITDKWKAAQQKGPRRKRPRRAKF